MAEGSLCTGQIPITSLLLEVIRDQTSDVARSVQTLVPEGDDGMLQYLQKHLSWKVFRVLFTFLLFYLFLLTEVLADTINKHTERRNRGTID
jgi:hypothetical protein